MASEPLSLADVYGEPDPLHGYAHVVDDVYGDGLELLIDHLDQVQIQERVQAQDWWTPHLEVDASTVEHAWITFDVHALGCSAHEPAIPGRDCDCAWEPWIAYHWREAEPHTDGAVPVTFVHLTHLADTRSGEVAA